MNGRTDFHRRLRSLSKQVEVAGLPVSYTAAAVVYCVSGGVTMDRRDFAGMLAALLGTAALATQAEGQAAAPAAAGAAPAPRPMKELASGVFKPQPGKGMVGGHESHQFLAGMLAGGTRSEERRVGKECR